MRDESKQERQFDGYTERLVVLAVLGHPRGCPRAQLLADLGDIEQGVIERAIASLEEAGLLELKATGLHPSAAMRRLDELAMICL
jgi:DNA-binding MarR family transcriptional regulator